MIPRLSFTKTKFAFLARIIGGLALALVLLIGAQIVLPAFAVDVPLTMGYQGRLKDANGDPLDGSYDFVVRIYDALAAGNLEYTETHNNVTVTNGYFTLQIGSVDANANPLDLSFDETYYISTEVDGDGEMTPRTKINSTAYAFKAGGIETAAADPTASDTSALREGRIYFNTGNNTLYVYSGATWNAVGGGSGAPADATYLVTSSNATLTNEVVTSSLAANLTFAGNDAAARTITFGQTNTFDDIVIVDSGNWTVDVNGNAAFDGTLAVNGDSISADGATLTINAGGNVNITDALTADSLTLDTGGLTLSNSETLNNSTDAVFTFGRNDAGIVTITASDDNAVAALTVTPGGAAALTLGTNGTTTAITLATDGTGDAEVVLPDGSISGTEILNDTVALTTDTAGDYVQSIANGNGIAGGNGGSEGAALTLALGALSADWDQTGSFDIVLNNAGSELRILESAGGAFYGTLEIGDLGADATYTFSGASGTVLTTANYTGTLNGVYLQIANNFSDVADDPTARTNIGLGTGDSPTFTGLTLSGTLAANGDTITSDGATLVINASGTVDVQDALTADSVTTDTTINFATNGEALLVSTDDTFTFDRDDAGIVTITASDDNAVAALTVTPGGAAALTLGTNGTTTAITLATDGTGDAEVVLPDQSVSSTEILNDTIVAGDLNATLTFADDDLINLSGINNSDGAEGLILPQAADCSTAVADGQICWQTTGDDLYIGDGTTAIQMNGGGGTLQSAYDGGNSIETASNTAVVITETENGATTGDLLQLTFGTGAAGSSSGDALQITLDSGAANGNTGNGIHLIVDASQNTGALALFEDDAGNDLFAVAEDGSITVAAGVGLDTNAAGALALGNANATSLTACNSAACDTLNFGTNTDADTINIGDTSNQDTVLLEGNASSGIDFGNFDVATTGAITVAAGVGLDTNAAGALTLGNTNATSVTMCNSAACDTISIGTNTDADTINIGDTSNQDTVLLEGNASSGIDFGNFDVATSGAITVAAGVGLDTNAAGALLLGNTNATSVSICNSAACDTVSIATNADADTVTIGNNTSTTALNFTSGTGAQTHTSSVQTGTTTTSGFVFDATAITSGTGLYITSDSVTSGRLVDIATNTSTITWTGNGTTNGLVNISSNSTAGTASNSSILQYISRSGANSNATHSAIGQYVTISNTGTTNSNTGAAYVVTGGSSNDIGLNIALGGASYALPTADQDHGIFLNSASTETSSYGIWSNLTGAATTNTAGYFSATGATDNVGVFVANGSLAIGTSSDNAQIFVATLAASGGSNGVDLIDATGQAGSGCATVDTVGGTSLCGVGADGSIILGTGGANTGSSANGADFFTAATGGGLSILTGAGGASNGANSSRNYGGAGGALSIDTGDGGGASDQGGAAGALTISTGNGGAGNNAAASLGGVGGAITITAGTGGNNGGGAGNGGNGGSITITAGNGGNGGTGTDGRGGDITLAPGTGSANGEVKISGTFQYTERLCHSGADGATQTGVSLGDCNSAGQADYAEMYPVEDGADYGDVVSVGTENVITEAGDTIKQLVKSATPYDSKVIGIVSNNYGDPSSIGYNIADEDNPMPIALNGRVPVKISTDSFDIEPGDLLTTSTEPGRAMKATQPGQVIGKALQAWSSASPTDTIMVFVGTNYADANSSSARYKTNIGGLTFGIEDVMRLRPVLFDWKNTDQQDLGFIAEEVAAINPLLAQYRNGEVEGVRYKLISVLLTQAIQEQQLQIENLRNSLGLSMGQIAGNSISNNISVVSDVIQGNITVIGQAEFGKDTVGRAIILAGSTSVKVTFENPYNYQPIVTATLRGDSSLGGSVSYAVVNETSTSFEIRISSPQVFPVEFNWHSFAAKEGKIFISDGTTQDIQVLILEEPALSPETQDTDTGAEPDPADETEVVVEEELAEEPAIEVEEPAGDQEITAEEETPPSDEPTDPEEDAGEELV